MKKTNTSEKKASAKADQSLAWKNKPGDELTSEELLAMPDSEYMNEQQRAFFRKLLEQQKYDPPVC